MFCPYNGTQILRSMPTEPDGDGVVGGPALLQSSRQAVYQEKTQNSVASKWG